MRLLKPLCLALSCALAVGRCRTEEWSYEALREELFGGEHDVVAVTEDSGFVDLPFSQNPSGLKVFVLAEGVTISNVGNARGKTSIYAFAPACFEKANGISPGMINTVVKGPYKKSLVELNGVYSRWKDTSYRPLLTVLPSRKCNSMYFYLPSYFRLKKCARLQETQGRRLDEWIIISGNNESPAKVYRNFGDRCPYETSSQQSQAFSSWKRMGIRLKKETERLMRSLMEEGSDAFSTDFDFKKEGIPTSDSDSGQIILVHSAPSMGSNGQFEIVKNACTNENLCLIVNRSKGKDAKTGYPSTPVPIAMGPSTGTPRMLIMDFGEGASKVETITSQSFVSAWG